MPQIACGTHSVQEQSVFFEVLQPGSALKTHVVPNI